LSHKQKNIDKKHNEIQKLEHLRRKRNGIGQESVKSVMGEERSIWWEGEEDVMDTGRGAGDWEEQKLLNYKSRNTCIRLYI